MHKKVLLTLGLAVGLVPFFYAQPMGHLSVGIGPNFPSQKIDYNNSVSGTSIATSRFIAPYFDVAYSTRLGSKVPLLFRFSAREISQGLSFPYSSSFSATTLGYNQFFVEAGPYLDYKLTPRIGVWGSVHSGIQLTKGLYSDKAFYGENESIFLDGTTATYYIPQYSPGVRVGIPLSGAAGLYYEFPAGHRLSLLANAGYGLLELHRLEADYFILNTPGQAPREIDFALVTRGSYTALGLSFSYAMGKYSGDERESRKQLTPDQLTDFREVRRDKALMGPTVGLFFSSVYPQLTVEGTSTDYLRFTALFSTNAGLRVEVPLAAHFIGQVLVEQQRITAAVGAIDPVVDSIGSNNVVRVEASGIKLSGGIQIPLFSRAKGKVFNPALSFLAGYYPEKNEPYPFHGFPITMGQTYRVTSFDINQNGSTAFFTGGASLDIFLGSWASINLTGEYTHFPEPLFQRSVEVEPLDGRLMASGNYALNPAGWSIRGGIQIPFQQYFYTKRRYLKQIAGGAD